MSRVDFSIANAFMKLRAPELEPIVAFVRAERLSALELMSACTEEWQWRKLQGRAQLAEELLRLVEDAPSLAAKLKGAPR